MSVGGGAHDTVVAIVLLHWGPPQLTYDCLRSLAALQYADLGVILVDNAGSQEPWEAAQPGLRLEVIRPPENVGFAAGANLGLLLGLTKGARYLMLLNNDTEVAPDLLAEMVSFVAARPAVGIVGPLICYHRTPDRIWSAGGRVDPATGACVSLLDGEDYTQGLTPLQVDYVSGCCLMIRREVIDRIGLLDERFFAYYEEVDWCARARSAGYEVWSVRSTKVWHKIEPDARSASPRYTYLMTRNRLLYLRNRRTSPSRLALTILRLDLPRVLAPALRPQHGGWHRSRSRVSGIVDFWRGRFGPPSR